MFDVSGVADSDGNEMLWVDCDGMGDGQGDGNGGRGLRPELFVNG